MWEIEDTPLLCSIVRWEVEGLFIHVRFSMAVNGIEQQHKLNTFNLRNLWHNLGITWKDGESCQNKITNHVHHPQRKTSLAWTCRKNGRWMDHGRLKVGELLNKTRRRHQKRQQQRGVAVHKQRTAQSIDFKVLVSETPGWRVIFEEQFVWIAHTSWFLIWSQTLDGEI